MIIRSRLFPHTTTDSSETPLFGGFFEEVADGPGLTILRRTAVPFPFESNYSDTSETDESSSNKGNPSLSEANPEPPLFVQTLLSLYYPHLFEEANKMADFSTVTEFSGKKGEKDAGRWLKNLEAVVKGTQPVLDYGKFVEVFDMKLTGEASEWANVTPEVYEVIDKDTVTEQDVTQLKRAFLFQFKTIRPEPIKATDELRDLYRDEGEKVEAYYRRANRILCRMIPGKDFEDDVILAALTNPEKIIMQQVVDKFMTGLRDDRIEFNVWKEQPVNLKTAAALAMKEENFARFWSRKKEEMSRRGYALSYPKANPSAPLVSPSHRTETGNSTTGSGQASPTVTPVSPGPIIVEIKNGAGNAGDSAGRREQNGDGVHSPKGGNGPGMGRGGGYQWARGGYQGGGYQGGGYQGGRGTPTEVVQSEPKPAPRPPGFNSQNAYINGDRKYNSRVDGPLCVECGILGHLPRSCTGPALTPWEKETIKRLVFTTKDGPGYFSTRMSRLYQASIPMKESEQMEALEALYQSHGIGEADLKTRAGKLWWGDEERESIRVNKGGITEGRRGEGTKVIQSYANGGAFNVPQPVSNPGGPPREIINPKQHRKRVAIEDIIDVEEGGRAAPRIIRTLSDEEKTTKGKKRSPRPPKLIKGLVGKQRRGGFMEYLWNQSITIPLLEFLQNSPTARRDLRQATTMEGGKKRRRRKVVETELDIEMTDAGGLGGMQGGGQAANVPQAVGATSFRTMKSQVDAGLGNDDPENWGSFMISGRISNIKRSLCVPEARVCIDAGSEAELITPSMVDALKLESIPMKKTPWPKLKLKTSVGELRDIMGIARGRISVGGVEVDFYACIIPEQSADNSEYDLLLGIPWLSGVKASINVEKSQVTIMHPRTQNRVTLKGPRFTSPDFGKLFLDFSKVEAKMQHLREDTESDGEESYTSDDEFSEEEEGESEEGDDSDSSSDEVRAPPSSPRNTNPRVNARSLKLSSCEGAAIEMGPGEYARYITPKEYLKLYGGNARYSTMAHHMSTIPRVEVGTEEAIMILDHDGRGTGSGGSNENPFHMSAKTEN